MIARSSDCTYCVSCLIGNLYYFRFQGFSGGDPQIHMIEMSVLLDFTKIVALKNTNVCKLDLNDMFVILF